MSTPADSAKQASCGLWSLWDMIEKHGLLFAKAIIAFSDAKMLCVPIHNNGQPYLAPIQGIIRVAQTGSAALRRACKNTRAKLGINDTERTDMALAGLKGKRLTYGATQEGAAD